MPHLDGHKLNPYAPPAAPLRDETSTETKRPRINSWGRGLAYAVPAAFIGALLPAAGMMVFVLISHLATEPTPVQRRDDFETAGLGAILPGIVCAHLFAMAAILNYSPAKPVGIMTALVYVGFSMVVALVLSAVAGSLRSVHPEGPRDLLLFLFVGPLAYTVIHTHCRMWKRAK